MTLDPSIIVSLFKVGTVAYIKVALLILIGLYALFILMLVTKIHSLNKTIYLPPESGEIVIRVFAILYFLAVVSLFIATLVIV